MGIAGLAFALVLITVMAGYDPEAGLVGEIQLILRPWSVGLGMGMVVATLHYLACRAVFARFLHRSAGLGRVAVATAVILLVHAAEIHLYGLGMFTYVQLFQDPVQLAGLDGNVTAGTGTLLDYLYFSYASYTSLGLGDIYPEGALRVLAGLEALIGLLMIGWTSAFFVLNLRELWFES